MAAITVNRVAIFALAESGTVGLIVAFPARPVARLSSVQTS